MRNEIMKLFGQQILKLINCTQYMWQLAPFPVFSCNISSPATPEDSAHCTECLLHPPVPGIQINIYISVWLFTHWFLKLVMQPGGPWKKVQNTFEVLTQNKHVHLKAKYTHTVDTIIEPVRPNVCFPCVLLGYWNRIRLFLAY